MFAGGGIGPFTGRSLHRLLEPHEHRAARRVAYIADLPVIALATASVEIAAAHRLGLPAETCRQIGSVEPGHHAASRSPMRWSG